MKKIACVPFIIAILLFLSSTCIFANESLREVSYLPRDFDWSEFWSQWNMGVKTQMAEDLLLIKNLGANTVRIIISPHIVGYPQPSAQFLTDFIDCLLLVDEHGLKAHVTLFNFGDFYPDLEHPGEEIPIEEVIANSKIWLDEFFNALSETDKQHVAVWELFNEIILYYWDKETGQWSNDPVERAHQWLQELFPYLKQKAADTPCTVSVPNVEWLIDIKDLSTPPDIFNFHWYPSRFIWTRPLPGTIDRAYEIIGRDERLMLGEFGWDTFWASEECQNNLFRDTLYYLNQKGISDFGVWTLNDFPEGTANFDGVLLPPLERHLGIYKIGDGNILEPKLSKNILQDAYHGSLPQSPSYSMVFNSSFEDINEEGGFYNWFNDVDPYDDVDPVTHIEQDTLLFHNGQASVRVSVPNPNPNGTDGGIFHLPALEVEPGASYVLRGYVRTQALYGGGVKFSLYWFNEEEVFINATESDIITDPDLDQWRLVELRADAPADARYVLIYPLVMIAYPSSRVWFDDITLQATICGDMGNQILKVNSIPYVATCDMVVPSETTLTIEPGVEIRFDVATGMDIYGTLNAAGQPARQIVFTSNSDDPYPGSWEGIYFDGAYPASTLQYCILEYADEALGFNWYYSTSGGFSHNIFRNNNFGVEAFQNNDFSISNSVFIDNDCGVLTNYGAGQLNMKNTIFIDNLTAIYSFGHVVSSYNCFWNNQINVYPNGQIGAGSIIADPLFINLGGEDYHLRHNSPAIDRGDPSSPHDPDHTRADIGVFYYHHSPPCQGPKCKEYQHYGGETE